MSTPAKVLEVDLTEAEYSLLETLAASWGLPSPEAALLRGIELLYAHITSEQEQRPC